MSRGATAVARTPYGTQNWQTRSQEFDDAVWTKTAVTITANDAIAPDGTLTADRITETSATSNHQVVSGLNLIVPKVVGQRVCSSCYVKDGTQRYVGLFANTYLTTCFDLQTGTHALVIPAQGGYQNGYWGIERVGTAGWFRIWQSWVVNNVGGQFYSTLNAMGSATTTVSHAGDTNKYFWAWGFQTVAANWPGLYQPTTGASITTPIPDRYSNAHNYILWSNTFTDGGWVKTGSAISASDTTGPDGVLLSASRLTCSAGTNLHCISRASQLSLFAGHTYTYSVHLKEGSHRYAGINVSAVNMTVDLRDGTIVASTLTGDANYTNVIARVRTLRDSTGAATGWYRATLTVTLVTATNASLVVAIFGAANSTLSWNAAGTEYVWVFGAQIAQANWEGGYVETIVPINPGPIANITTTARVAA